MRHEPEPLHHFDVLVMPPTVTSNPFSAAWDGLEIYGPQRDTALARWRAGTDGGGWAFWDCRSAGQVARLTSPAQVVWTGTRDAAEAVERRDTAVLAARRHHWLVAQAAGG